MSKWKEVTRRLLAGVLTVTMVAGSIVFSNVAAKEAEAATQKETATLTVDLDPAENTGDIGHGAAGFLYGVSSENVPTTNTLVPLKAKALCTKGALGTEHPYGDALDVAKTFLESGGEQVMMYNSNYYGVFGVTANYADYAQVLEETIAPAVAEWKEAWKEEHSDDNLSRLDIDAAIFYIPINEGTPVNGADFNTAWKTYYDAIKAADPNAAIAGPNSCGYNLQFTSGIDMESYIQYCADNDCMPDVITWHELETDKLYLISDHMEDFNDTWYNRTDWTQYKKDHPEEFAEGSDVPEMPQVCFNEYAEMAYCGVPGRLVNWISRIEDEKVTGCLPFWHQANNLNDLAAGANEGNGAWWLYKWYGDMSGTTQPVTSSTDYDELYGVSAMDEAKKISTTLLGGFSGDITVTLENVTATETFEGDSAVHVAVQETMFTGFHGAASEPPTILEGAYSVADDGSVTITISDALFENAYCVTVTQASEDEVVNIPLTESSGTVYEAENAEVSGTASATAADSSPSYYMSNDGVSGNRAVDMPTGGILTYTIDVPVDGKYRLDFAYGSGQGTSRNNMYAHNSVNLTQTFALDDEEAQSLTMESTLFQTMTGIKTLYYDLDAGEHTIMITTPDGADAGLLLHDFVRVTYAGVYGEEQADFNKVYEAELADVNRLLDNTNPSVVTETALDGYSGGGYVTVLSDCLVTEGGGIRNTVVVDESGLYNITLRYLSTVKCEAGIYVENTARTLDRKNQTMTLAAGNTWQTATVSVYLQKGINIVDIDTTADAALDYMRVQALPSQDYSTVIEAEDAVPAQLADSIEVAESDGASGGAYVVGMEGAYSNPDYLEFTYYAEKAGQYQMQVFHSNEDLAGSHWYNIKTVDKYAVVEVNGESDSPQFVLADEETDSDAELYYFVDCGDHDPSTVTAGDSLGTNNSVTDQMYGEDEKTGYSWGLVMEAADEVATPGAGSMVSSADDKAVYTNYQKALSNAASDLADGQSKKATFRYAHGQSEAGISPRYVSYKFELEPGVYSVTVCMGNSWNNAGSPTVTLGADGVDAVSEAYSVAGGGNTVKTMLIDLSNAEVNVNGKVELSVKATSEDATIQMNYIQISAYEDTEESRQEYIYLPPYGVKALAGDSLPDGIWTGELVPGMDWFIDYRNLKNETNRYFFLNTFSDDTFREKTITLNLVQGENTIRIYNDNSWNVTYGGTTSTPGTENLVNYTPNFDKFVITPITLDTAVQLETSYNITIRTSEGGYVTADRNTVLENGSYVLTITANKDILAAKALINGEEQTIAFEDAKSCTLQIENVNEDQEIEVYFAGEDVTREALQILYDSYKDLEKNGYSDTSWAAFARALSAAGKALADENTAQWKINEVYEALLAAVEGLEDISALVYFVDCGDHNPATLSSGDNFGRNNSVTDKIYGMDEETGYYWGVWMEASGEVETPGEGSMVSSDTDYAVYTTYQKALSNSESDLLDGKSKEKTFRYAHSQDSAGINPRYVTYKFEVEQGEYQVSVGMSNTWSNAGSPTVTLSADGAASVSEKYSVSGNSVEKTQEIDLSDAEVNENGKVVLTVRATSTDPTIQMNYIIIEDKVEEVTPTETPEPTDTPNPDPTKTPEPTVTASPIPTKTPDNDHVNHVGKTFVANGLKYKVTKDDENGREVRVTSMKTKKSTLTIPAKVTNSNWGETFKVTSIKAKAFKGTAITKAAIGKNVTKIGPNAFKGCTKLKTVVIGKNVKTIGTRAFYGCTKLTKITIKSKVLKNVKKNAFKKISKKAVIKVPTGKKTAYKKKLKGKIARGVTVK